MAPTNEENRAFPLADSDLTQKLLDLIQQSNHHKQLRKGANEGKNSRND